jgi:hypothetical protein
MAQSRVAVLLEESAESKGNGYGTQTATQGNHPSADDSV